MKTPSIFVQIACYRDIDCQWTVKDLFDKAAHPERISVGICWQIIPEQDQNCFMFPYPRSKQVRQVFFNAVDRTGYNWARYHARKLWNNEDYILQIDSKTRFKNDWDNVLIDILNNCSSAKSILTAHLPNYHNSQQPITKIVINKSMKNGSCHFSTLPMEQLNLPEQGAFVSNNFLFSSSDIIKDVPIDPEGSPIIDELFSSIRYWTHGWDIYHPNKTVLYTTNPESSVSNTFNIANIAEKITNHLKFSKENHFKDKHLQFGLGTTRAYSDYEIFSGAYYSSEYITQKANLGNFRPFINPRRNTLSKNGKIFVHIPAYRDPQTQWTIKNMFDKAKFPQRIVAGVCWQIVPEYDQEYVYFLNNDKRIRNIWFDARNARGLTWARYQAQQLFDGEEFVLQIDSHMRFAQDWDEQMINMLDMCPSNKPVLSQLPAGYLPPDQRDNNTDINVRTIRHIDRDTNITLSAEVIGSPYPTRPLKAAFIAGAYVFGPARSMEDVPADPYLYFGQEELNIAARLWTHGWDIFAPNQMLLYHLYKNKHIVSNLNNVMHWENSNWPIMDKKAELRMSHIFKIKLSNDPLITQKLDIYGLGKERTLEEYEAFSGVFYKENKIMKKATKGLFEDYSYNFINS